MTKNLITGTLVLSAILFTSCGANPEVQNNSNTLTPIMENMNENITLDSLDLEYSMNSNMNTTSTNMNADEDEMGLSMNGSLGEIANMNINSSMSTSMNMNAADTMELLNTSEGTTSSMN